MKENEILKLLGLTEKKDAGNTGLSEVTGRAFGYGNVDIDRGK